MDMRDLYWAAGFLEGEGSFMNQRFQVVVSAVQVQREPLERLLSLLGGKIYFCRKKNPKHSDYFKWNTQGSRGAGVAMTLFSLLSTKRREQILKALAHWKTVPYNVNAAKTHCPSGHEYTPGNTYTSQRKLTGKNGGVGSYRVCRACRNVARDRNDA